MFGFFFGFTQILPIIDYIDLLGLPVEFPQGEVL